MRVTLLLDTNVVIYLTTGPLADPLPSGIYRASVITEIEFRHPRL